jgi:hypothetical protein
VVFDGRRLPWWEARLPCVVPGCEHRRAVACHGDATPPRSPVRPALVVSPRIGCP